MPKQLILMVVIINGNPLFCENESVGQKLGVTSAQGFCIGPLIYFVCSIYGAIDYNVVGCGLILICVWQTT